MASTTLRSLQSSTSDTHTRPTGSLLRLVIRRRGTELIVRVAGDVDLVTAPTLAEALDRVRRELGAADLVVDLRTVPFLSAAGLRVLVETHHACADAGTGFRMVAEHSAVTRPLALTGLDRALHLTR